MLLRLEQLPRCRWSSLDVILTEKKQPHISLTHTHTYSPTLTPAIASHLQLDDPAPIPPTLQSAALCNRGAVTRRWLPGRPGIFCAPSEKDG